jgi:3-dehydroquinate synthase
MKIVSKIKSYELKVIERALDQGDLLASIKHNRRFYFIDAKFFELYKEQLINFIGKDFYLVIEAKEEHKEYLKLADYFKALIDAGFTRNDCLVTFGGGILQDLSGFVASTLYRGIKWVFFPTTLLAQADSCIGSKTSINFSDSKNLIGTFYPPDLIIVDTAFTRSLPNGDFNSGVGEIIKFHLLSDQVRYDILKKFLNSGVRQSPHLQEVIASTLEIKRSYFEQDEFDTGIRNLLNYGHCLGHALESAVHFAVPHGEAVIVGMGFANLVSLKRGLMTRLSYDEFEAIFKRHYPKFDIKSVSADAIIQYMKRDKKRVSPDLTMILGLELGKFGKYDDLKEAEIKSAWTEFLEHYPKG